MEDLHFRCILSLDKYSADILSMWRWRSQFIQATGGLDSILQLTII